MRPSLLSIAALLAVAPISANAQELEGFAIVSGQSITNTGSTTIIGNIAISPGSTYTGSASVTQTGATYLGEEVASRIQSDLTTLYNVLAGRPTSTDLTGRNLGGLTLGRGVYNYDTSADLATGQTLILDGNGDPNAVFIFNIGSTLTVGGGATIQLVNGAQGGNVFYRVGSSATVNTSAAIEGQIVALTSISLLTSSRITCGAALAREGSVTLDTNTIRVCDLTGVSFVDAVNGVIPDDGEETPPDDGGETPPDEGEETPPDEGGETPPDEGEETPPDEDGETPSDEDGETPPVEPGETPPDEAGETPPLDPEVPEPEGVTAPPNNVIAPATALDRFVANGGVLPVSFAILAAALTQEELVDALAQMSGEVATGVAPTALRAADTFLDQVLRARSGPENAARRAAVAAPVAPATPATISVLGYWPLPTENRAWPIVGQPAADLAQPSWDFWMGATGDYSETDGGARLGSHARTSNQYGVALGTDYFLSPSTTVGWAVGTSRSNFELDSGFGEGGSDNVQAAIYARTRYEAAYLSGAIAYGYHDMWTDRTITFAGNDRLRADFAAHTMAANVEAGYKIGWVTPFVGLRGRMLMTPDYSEETLYGASTFALDYGSRTTTSLRTEVGAQVQWSTPVTDTAVLDLRLRGAWLHELDDVSDVDASFQFLGSGSKFTVSGAEVNRDSLSLTTGAELRRTDGLYVSGALDAQLSSDSQAYGGALKVGIRW